MLPNRHVLYLWLKPHRHPFVEHNQACAYKNTNSCACKTFTMLNGVLVTKMAFKRRGRIPAKVGIADYQPTHHQTKPPKRSYSLKNTPTNPSKLEEEIYYHPIFKTRYRLSQPLPFSISFSVWETHQAALAAAAKENVNWRAKIDQFRANIGERAMNLEEVIQAFELVSKKRPDEFVPRYLTGEWRVL